MKYFYPIAKVSLLSLLAFACAPENAPQAAGPKGGQTCKNTQGTANSGGTALTASGDCSLEAQQPTGFEEDVPRFQVEELYPGFNRAKLPKVKLPDDYNKKTLMAKFSAYARPIWLDLNNVNTKIDVSVWQPLPIPSLIEQTDDVVFFKLVGHALKTGHERPAPSLVISENITRYGQKDFDTAPYKRPDTYEVVFENKGSEDAASELRACEKLKPQVDENYFHCQEILNGMSEVTYNPTTGEHNNAFNILYQKQSVAIWKAICPKDYQPLGHVSTNGDIHRPFSVQDFAQSIFDGGAIPSVTTEAAMYCVKEKYLVEGKLGEPIFRTGDSVVFYEIVAADETKGINGRMFHAVVKSEAATPQPKLWVLSKEHTLMMEENVTLPGAPK